MMRLRSTSLLSGVYDDAAAFLQFAHIFNSVGPLHLGSTLQWEQGHLDSYACAM